MGCQWAQSRRKAVSARIQTTNFQIPKTTVGPMQGHMESFFPPQIGLLKSHKRNHPPI